jgi:arylsulfatase
MISHLDRDVGRITALLKELKIDDNTLIIFTSDNGATHAGGVDYKFFNSVGELRGLKGSLWEGGIRVPFVAKWPGKIKPGSTSDHISGFQDMMPTIGDITGYRSPADIDGISFLPTLLGTTGQAEHKCLYWEFKAYGGQQAVRMGKWKGIRRGLQRNPNAPIQLYNLETDLSEKNDLAKKYPEVVEKIQKLMQSERVASKVFPFKALDK